LHQVLVTYSVTGRTPGITDMTRLVITVTAKIVYRFPTGNC